MTIMTVRGRVTMICWRWCALSAPESSSEIQKTEIKKCNKTASQCNRVYMNSPFAAITQNNHFIEFYRHSLSVYAQPTKAFQSSWGLDFVWFIVTNYFHFQTFCCRFVSVFGIIVLFLLEFQPSFSSQTDGLTFDSRIVLVFREVHSFHQTQCSALWPALCIIMHYAVSFFLSKGHCSMFSLFYCH